jgi:hypothetical protein
MFAWAYVDSVEIGSIFYLSWLFNDAVSIESNISLMTG